MSVSPAPVGEAGGASSPARGPTDRTVRLALAVAVALSFALFSFLSLRIDSTKRVIQGVDGICYTLPARSLLTDGDLDFADEIDALHAGQLPGMDRTTATGLRPNKYGVGVSLLAFPFVATARAAAQDDGSLERAQAFTVSERMAFCFASAFYGLLGLILSHASARRLGVSAPSAALAVFTLLVGSNLSYYFVREPFASHLSSMFCVALALRLLLAARERRHAWPLWLAVGAASGLAICVRPTNVLFLVVPAWWLGHALREEREPATARAATALAVGVGLGVLPQLWVWRTLYGSWLAYAYDAESFVNWSRPKVLHVLFASRHGLLSWSPILLLALAGMPFVYRAHRRLAIGLGLWAGALLYAISSWEQWWLGHSFGHRGFLCLFPVFVVGLGALLDRVASRRGRRWILVALAAAIAWNAMLMLAFLSEMIPYSGSFSWWELLTAMGDLPRESSKR